MVPFDQILNWLSYDTHSRLRAKNISLIQVMRSAPELAADQACQDLLFNTQQPEPPIDYAEVISFCGVYYCERGHFDDAINYLVKAAKFFENQQDVHRAAMVEMILYTITCAHRNAEEAFNWARKSCLHLLDRARFYHRFQNVDMVNWYRERIADIANDVIAAPATTYQCLFEFQGSTLKPSAQQIQSQIDSFIKKGDQKLALDRLDYLKRVTAKTFTYRETVEGLAFSAFRETVEGFAFSALKTLQLGHPERAVLDLKRAIACCSPESHEQLFLRWILGLEQIKIESEWCRGIENLEMCVRHIEMLARTADRQDNFDKRTWYEAYRSAMRSTLDQRVKNWKGSVRALPAASH